MKNNDKIIVVFLVSVGVFSTTQASQYINTLSLKEKKALLSVASNKSVPILLASGSDVFVQDGDDNKKS